MNTHVALSMFMGMANGPLIRRFGYRKMSVVGACFFTIGIMATAFANTRTHYLITYSIITGKLVLVLRDSCTHILPRFNLKPIRLIIEHNMLPLFVLIDNESKNYN